MEKIANFYRAAKDLGWSTLEILDALNTEQFATLEKQILAAKPAGELQRVKLFSPSLPRPSGRTTRSKPSRRLATVGKAIRSD